MISDGLWYAGTSKAQYRNDNCCRWSVLHISVFTSGMAFRHLQPENQSFVKGEWLVTVRLANHRIIQVGRDPREVCSPAFCPKWGQHWIQIRLLRTFSNCVLQTSKVDIPKPLWAACWMLYYPYHSCVLSTCQTVLVAHHWTHSSISFLHPSETGHLTSAV